MHECVDIIIPVYNRAHLVERTLESVWQQTYRPLRVIIVDNNSSDNSAEVSKTWAVAHQREDFTIEVLSERKPGATAARNCGLRHARSRRIMFFDSDDIMRPQLVELASAAFDNDPEVKLAYWRALRHTSQGKYVPTHFTRTRQLDFQLVHSILTTTFYMVDAQFFRSAGAWDESVGAWNDWETGVRLLLLQPKCQPVDHVLTDVMEHPDSITGETFAAKAGVWEWALDAAETAAQRSSHPQKRRVLQIICYRRVILAAHYRRENRIDLAEPLLEKALASPHLNLWQRLALKGAYAYTAKGGRGAFLFISPLLSR